MSYTIGGTVYPWDVSGIITASQVITIPNYINITDIILSNDVYELADYAFCPTPGNTPYCPLLNTIVMNGVKKIGMYNFSSYINLTDVSMTNLITIASYSFRLSGIRNLYAPVLTAIGTYACYNCTSLQTVYIPNFSGAFQGGVFYGCSQLTSISGSERATSVGVSVFYGCSSLTSIDISNSTSILSNAFYNCTSLSDINMPNVTAINASSFYNCVFTTINAPNATTLSSSAFANCTKLETISFPKLRTIATNAFNNCPVNNIIIPNTVTTVSNNSFLNCSGLKTITINHTTPTLINAILYNHKNIITTVNLPNATSIPANTFSLYSTLKSVYMPAIITINSLAFDNCVALQNLYINSGIIITSDPNSIFGSSNMNDFCIITDNAQVLSATLNALTTNTSNFKSDNIRMEYNPTSKSATGDMVITHTPAITPVQYSELLTTFIGTEPTTGIHKTIYDNINNIKTGLLLNAYNSAQSTNYSNIYFNLVSHYKSLNSYINTAITFIPGATTQPDTTELIMTFTSGAFSKKLVYKLNK